MEPPKTQLPPEEIYVQYTVHQLRQQPWKAVLVVAAILLVAVLAYWAESAFFGVIALAIMVFSVSWFLFPIRYKVSNRGIYWRTLFGNEQRDWSQFYDYGVYPDAVQLLFDYRNLRGRIKKGVLIYFDLERKEKDKLIEAVKKHVARPARIAKAGTDSDAAPTEKDSAVTPAIVKDSEVAASTPVEKPAGEDRK